MRYRTTVTAVSLAAWLGLALVSCKKTSHEDECLEERSLAVCRAYCGEEGSEGSALCPKLLKRHPELYRKASNQARCTEKDDATYCARLCQKNQDPEACRKEKELAKLADCGPLTFGSVTTPPADYDKPRAKVECQVSLTGLATAASPVKVTAEGFVEANGELGLLARKCDGRTLEVDGKPIPFNEEGARFTVPLLLRMAGLTVQQLRSRTDIKEIRVPLKLTTARGVSTGTLTCEGSSLFLWVKSMAEKGPFRFPGEDPKARSAGRSAVGVLKAGDRFLGSNILGADVPLRDLDLIASLNRKDQQLPDCQYRGEKTGAKKSVARYAETIEVTLLDRRTGKIVKKHVLRAPAPGCEAKVHATLGYINSELPADRAWEWVAKQLRR